MREESLSKDEVAAAIKEAVKEVLMSNVGRKMIRESIEQSANEAIGEAIREMIPCGQMFGTWVAQGVNDAFERMLWVSNITNAIADGTREYMEVIDDKRYSVDKTGKPKQGYSNLEFIIYQAIAENVKPRSK